MLPLLAATNRSHCSSVARNIRFLSGAAAGGRPRFFVFFAINQAYPYTRLLSTRKIQRKPTSGGILGVDNK